MQSRTCTVNRHGILKKSSPILVIGCAVDGIVEYNTISKMRCWEEYSRVRRGRRLIGLEPGDGELETKGKDESVAKAGVTARKRESGCEEYGEGE